MGVSAAAHRASCVAQSRSLARRGIMQGRDIGRGEGCPELSLKTFRKGVASGMGLSTSGCHDREIRHQARPCTVISTFVNIYPMINMPCMYVVDVQQCFAPPCRIPRSFLLEHYQAWCFFNRSNCVFCEEGQPRVHGPSPILTLDPSPLCFSLCHRRANQASKRTRAQPLTPLLVRYESCCSEPHTERAL